MIAIVQCLPPARLRKIRHVQLVWRHDNILPTDRTSTVTILIHPQIWFLKTYLCRQQRPNRYPRLRQLPPPSTSRAQPLSTSAPSTTMTNRGRPKPITRQAGTKRSRAARIAVCSMELFLRDYPKQVVTLAKAKSVPTNMREFLSWAQRHYRIDVTASTVERKTVGWHLPARAQVDAKSLLTNVRTSIPASSRAISAVPFEGKNVTRSDKIQPYVLIDTRTTKEATHTRERRIVSIVELTLTLFRVISSTLSRQHVQLL